MLSPSKCSEIWSRVVSLFSERDERGRVRKTPREMSAVLLSEYSLRDIREVLSVVARFKAHDGRIYGREWTYVGAIPVNPDCTIRDRRNPMFNEKLDAVHTTHIHQLISEIMVLDPDRC